MTPPAPRGGVARYPGLDTPFTANLPTLSSTAASGWQRPQSAQDESRSQRLRFPPSHMQPDLFETRLSRMFEGFCPYCETQFREWVEETKDPRLDPADPNPEDPGEWSVIRARCACCAGLYKSINNDKRGPGWIGVGGHNCEHVGDWGDDDGLAYAYADRITYTGYG